MYANINTRYLYFTKDNYSSEKELKEDMINTIFTLFKNGYEVVVKDEGVGYPVYFVDEDENIGGEVIAVIDPEIEHIETYNNNNNEVIAVED